MLMTVPTLSSSNFCFKSLVLPPKISSPSKLRIQIHSEPFCSATKIQAFNPVLGRKLSGCSGKRLGFSLGRQLGFSVRAGNSEEGHKNGVGGGGDVNIDEAEKQARGESTMPDRFRYLTKEAPDPPLRWPWFVALVFLVYAWRAVLFELMNWRKAALAVVRFVGYILKFALALIFHFIGDPITSLIRCIETILYTIRAFYSGIVAYAPVPELTMVIVLASVVLSVAEATVPNYVNDQPYLLTVSGLIGYAAVRGFISEPLFWTLLLGLYGFSRLVKKRDEVSSTLPVAAVLAAVGEPWVRFLVIISYMALAISHHSKRLSEEKEVVKVTITERRLPIPLLGAALAIGIHLAAKWAGYRHLTWMIV
ncbi:Embryo defective protein [Quillaja saponaria]|uniref:Embryo defective protein n=1 Tax=Quillaja saponaria TaxID=32244 RepID=A0AAD7VMX0_QUISA|nr:Embryo defective protein [Quillaja saponaria]